MKLGSDVKCSEVRSDTSRQTQITMEPDRQQMKHDVLMEMGLAILDDDDEPVANSESQCAVALRSPYSRAEPVEVKHLKQVAEDLSSFANPFGDDFTVFSRQKSPVQLRQDYFSKLSDEVVLTIFRWLPKKTLIRCALVCRRWRRIAYDEGLWTRVDLGCKSLLDGSLADVVKRGVRILRLAQADIPDPVFKVNALPVEFCSRLQYLDLSMTVASPEGLATLLQTTKYLVKLSLEHCTLNENAFKAIAQNSQLEVLNLAMCYNVTTTGLEVLLNSCRKLTALNLAWTSLNTEALDVLMSRLPPKLLQLNISGFKEALNDKHLALLVRGSPLLTELDLSDSMITSASLDVICNLKHLEYLCLNRCFNVCHSRFPTLTTMPSLRYVNAFGLPVEIKSLQYILPGIELNKFMFSSIARPTVGIRRTSIWGLRSRD